MGCDVTKCRGVPLSVSIFHDMRQNLIYNKMTLLTILISGYVQAVSQVTISSPGKPSNSKTVLGIFPQISQFFRKDFWRHGECFVRDIENACSGVKYLVA